MFPKLYFLNFFLIINAKFDCNFNDTVFLKINEIAFFTTTNFPLLMSADEFYSCKLKFSLIYTNHTNFKLLVAFFETTSLDDVVQSDFLFNVYNSSSYSLQDPFYIPFDFISQQGLALFELDNNDERCPMESISRETPFKFFDETQIFHFQSAYQPYQKRKNSCKWQFIAPEGYGFKVVIIHFSISSKIHFQIFNSTDNLANERNVKSYHPYYNNDNEIRITLSAGDPNLFTKMELQGYVTIVKKDFNVVNQNCSIASNYDSITWYQNGYDNNFRCTFNLSIPNNTEIIVSYFALALETNMDFVKLIGKNSSEILQETSQFIMRPNKFGFGNDVMFEFISDGSVQSLGFDIYFIEMFCQCSNFTISCDIFTFNIMDDTDYYCGNLKCKFMIEPCLSDLILINIEMTIEKSLFLIRDIFRITSNNVTVFEINNYNTETLSYFIYLNSTNYNIFEAITYPSEIVRTLAIHVLPGDAPSIDFIVKLSSSLTSYIIDTGLYNLISVETDDYQISDKTDFVIYSSIYDGVPLYNNKSLTLNLGNSKCFNNPDLYKCEINTDKFVIFTEATASRYPILVVRLKTFKSMGCVFKENVCMSNFSNNFTVVAIASTDQSCSITILLDNTYYISYLWTTATIKNVEVFIGANQNIPYFQFNSTSAKTWKNIKLFSPVFTVKIPKNAAIYITLNHDLSQIQSIQNFQFKSMVTTPLFGVSKKTYDNFIDQSFLEYIIGNITVKFTAVEYNISDGDEFYFYSGSVKSNINKAGDSVLFKNQNVTLVFSYQRDKKVNNGAMFLIEAIKNNID